MMLGDFNFPDVDWANFNSNDTYINMLQSFANNLFVEQHVTVPTRESNLLDLVFSHDDIINSINVDETVVSDHKILKI